VQWIRNAGIKHALHTYHITAQLVAKLAIFP